MSKVRLLFIAVILLLVLNLFLLSISFFGEPKNGQKGKPGDERHAEQMLIERLNFSEEQGNTFRALKAQHKNKVQPLNLELSENQRALFELLKSDSMDIEEKKRLNQLISENTSKINELHLNHFQDLKNLGNEKQKVLFNEFISEMSKRFMTPQGPPPRRDGPPRRV